MSILDNYFTGPEIKKVVEEAAISMVEDFKKLIPIQHNKRRDKIEALIWEALYQAAKEGRLKAVRKVVNP